MGDKKREELLAQRRKEERRKREELRGAKGAKAQREEMKLGLR
jgi:hypothetical protein